MQKAVIWKYSKWRTIKYYIQPKYRNLNDMKNLLFVTSIFSALAIFSCCVPIAIVPVNKQSLVLQPLRDIIEVEGVPKFFNMSSISFGKEPIPVEDISKAVGFFYMMWEERYGDKDQILLRNLNFLTIISSDEIIQLERGVYDTDGVWFPGKVKVVGLTYTPIHIWIWIDPSHKISDTSLIHELVHVAILSSNGGISGDADHEGNLEPYWTKDHTMFIDVVNQAIKDNGK